ncbi:IS5 family transposase [Streptomyces clavifer]|uniref:IS5 family transposase n=1 Tax=Streptomyces clavifer TaxID=68188 RepID=UPI0038B4E09B
MGRGDLSDVEWAQLVPDLPTNVGRSGRWHCHRRVINGVLFRLRTGLPWRDLPPHFGKWQTVYDRHRRWSADGTWERVLHAVLAAADAAGRPACRGRRRPSEDRSDEAVGRSRGGLTTKIYLASDGSRRPLSVLITPGQWGDAPQLITVLDRIRVPRPAGGLPRTRPDHVCGDKAYSSRRNRQYLRRRQIQHTIPERRDQRDNRRRRGSRGGRPTAFDQSRYARRNEVERCINALKGSRAVATRYDKRAYVFHGTATLAALPLWLRP